MDRQKEWRDCNKCGKKLSSDKTLWQHKKTGKFNDRVKSLSEDANANSSSLGSVKSQKKPNKPQVSSFINRLVNEEMKKSKVGEKTTVNNLAKIPYFFPPPQKSATVYRPYFRGGVFFR